MGQPSTKDTNKAKNRNNFREVSDWLKEAHPGRNLLFNFGRSKMKDMSTAFDNQVVELAWDRGALRTHTPQIQIQMQYII